MFDAPLPPLLLPPPLEPRLLPELLPPLRDEDEDEDEEERELLLPPPLDFFEDDEDLPCSLFAAIAKPPARCIATS
ncbi:MAG: hypothetical protein M3Q69_01190 [Acidobacteriota bacterium]|nr:hypothetical protein [Acidobacteriota bacterium]